MEALRLQGSCPQFWFNHFICTTDTDVYVSFDLFLCVLGEEGPSRVHNLYVQYQDLIQNFQQADNEVTRLKQNLVCLCMFMLKAALIIEHFKFKYKKLVES